METDPGRFIPEADRRFKDDNIVKIDLRRPMPEILAELSKHPVTTRVSLTGPMIVARDSAHAKLQERIDAGLGLPQYIKDHPVYYAGPAKTPSGFASGSFGPTTAGRMDSYVNTFQSHGGSMVMLAKGNRSQAVTDVLQSRTAASTSAASAARRRSSLRTISRRSKCSNIPNWAWRPSGASKWKTSRPSSSSTTRATTSL